MDFDPSYTAQQFKSVGTRPLRPDGVDKVTGRARYGADFNMPGQLVGRVLRSPHAHAIIRKIDTSKAEALKGVKAVVTAVKTWKYTPCKYQGQAISVWIPVTIPFTLKGG